MAEYHPIDLSADEIGLTQDRVGCWCCPFFREVYRTEDNRPSSGNCRRYPPRDKAREPEDGDSFPMVEYYDICGEHPKFMARANPYWQEFGK